MMKRSAVVTSILLAISIRLYNSTNVVDDNVGWTDGDQDQDIRPIWNIAHMANSIEELDNFVINSKANGVEVDVEFEPETGVPIRTHHMGAVCDCRRECERKENFTLYLQRVVQLTRPDSPNFQKHFQLIFFDLKTGGFEYRMLAESGRNLAQVLTEHLWDYGSRDLNVRVLFCLYGLESLIVAAAFHERMKQLGMEKALRTTGWDMTGYMSVDEVASGWESMNFTCRVWQGDGMSNCYSYACDRLQAILDFNRKRKRAGKQSGNPSQLPYPCQIYYWTTDDETQMHNLLNRGVNGMITNSPEMLNSILNSPDSRFRLANDEDSPWKSPNQCLDDMISTQEAIALVTTRQNDNKLEMLKLILRGYFVRSSKC